MFPWSPNSLQETKYFILFFHRTPEVVVYTDCHQFLLPCSLLNSFWPSFGTLIPTNLFYKVTNDMHAAQPNREWSVFTLPDIWVALDKVEISLLLEKKNFI